ncbi:MAG: Ig domain-containing protein, partial [Planctomycetota bacterium]
FTAAGGAPAYTWAVSAGSLPPGVSLGSGTGQLTGTPSTAGNYAFTIRVTDTNNDTDTRGYTVAVLNQPQITSPAAGALPPATRNAPNYTQTFTGANGKTPYSWSATGLPPGMTINPISGVVSGTPTGVATTYNVDVTLTDANGKTALVSYTLLLNGAMTITANSVSDGEEQVAYSQAISTSGGTTPFTFGLTIDPVLPDLTIDSSTGVISGTPSVGTGGNYDFYVTVTDSLGGTTNKAFSFYITLPTGGTAANCGCNSRATARDSAFAGWLWLLLPLLLLLARRRGD